MEFLLMAERIRTPIYPCDHTLIDKHDIKPAVLKKWEGVG